MSTWDYASRLPNCAWHVRQVRKEMEGESFERFNKLLDKIKATKNADEGLLCLLKAQVRCKARNT